MSYPYTPYAKRGREHHKEQCTSAGEALVWLDELRDRGWTDISFVDDFGVELPISAMKQKTAEDQARVAALLATFKSSPSAKEVSDAEGT